MLSDSANKTNENNLKLRNSYRRYFIWGSKETPGFNKNLKKPKRNFSFGLKSKLEKANNIKLEKIVLTLLIFLTIVFVITYLVWKL